MDNKRIARLLAIVAVVVLGILLLSTVGPQVFDALLAMHGL